MASILPQITGDALIAGVWQQQLLLQWALAGSFQIVSATYDTNGAIVTANIIWPDGASGLLTTDVASATFLGAIDAWHATYSPDGVDVAYTVTQPQVTRNSLGRVTIQPAITVS